MINLILRFFTAAYFIGQYFFMESMDPLGLLTMIPIMIIAVRKSDDKTNLLLSIMVSAGLAFDLIGRYFMPRSFFFETNGDMTLFGQITMVIWALCEFTGVFILALRDMVIDLKNGCEKGRYLKGILFGILVSAAVLAAIVLGVIVWMAVTNYYP